MTAEEFVKSSTSLSAPPLVPEIRLHLAGEVLPLWRKTEEVLGREGVPPPYWAFAWPGGQALARFILDRKLPMDAVLDFGAGSGLVAIAAAKAGARKATAADIDPFAAAAISLNAAVNRVQVEVAAGDVIGQSGWDTVLVGDMCYERPLAERLTAWLSELGRAGAAIYLGDPGRSYFPQAKVEKLASYTVPTSRDLEDRDSRQTGVYRFTA